jgi:flagellar biosynthesis/type III secretory pathway ATPase
LSSPQSSSRIVRELKWEKQKKALTEFRILLSHYNKTS